MEDINLDLLAAHPHDAFIKNIFSDPVLAAALFKGRFPLAVTQKMQWKSLRLVPGSFVKQSLHQAHSDLLFSVQAGGAPCLIYFLFEHQTTVDERMPLRLLSYTLEIMRNHIDAHDLPLPPVLQLVLHQGPDRWTVSPCFEDLFALPSAQADVLLPFLPKFRHALLDLSQYDPQQPGEDATVRAVLALAKLARETQRKKASAWLEILKKLPRKLLRKGLLYMFNVDTAIDVEEIASTLDNNDPFKEEIMTTAAALIAKGRIEGEARGKAEGKAEGEAIGRLTVLQEILRLPVSSKEELAGLDLAELESRYKEMQRRYDAQFKGA